MIHDEQQYQQTKKWVLRFNEDIQRRKWELSALESQLESLLLELEEYEQRRAA